MLGKLKLKFYFFNPVRSYTRLIMKHFLSRDCFSIKYIDSKKTAEHEFALGKIVL